MSEQEHPDVERKSNSAHLHSKVKVFSIIDKWQEHFKSLAKPLWGGAFARLGFITSQLFILRQI